VTDVRFLKITLPLVAIPALIILFLPAHVWPRYVDVVEPLSLFTGALLALYVSFMYRKQLRVAFVCLSTFLFIYVLAIVFLLSFSPVLVPVLERRMTQAEIFSLVQSIQFVNYAMLFLFCIYLLRVVDVTQLNRTGWLLFALTCIFSIAVAAYPVFESLRGVSRLDLPLLSRLVMRLFDAALIIILMPVVWLYVQYLKSQRQQSLTFTVIVFGIVFSTIFDYLFEFILAVFPQSLPSGSVLNDTIPEILFVYGYAMIAVGLYGHRKQDEWGYKAIERAMTGESELADVE